MELQHVIHADFEMPGVIELWARERGVSQNFVRPFAGEVLPAVEEFEALIVMGGPQSPLSMDESPYLRGEIALIAEALRREIPVLGFCLGAQLIGEALGARTERSPHREIGVLPIDLTPAGEIDPMLHGLPSRFTVVHWHNDMPGLTTDAEVLATSAGCPRQIVRYNRRTYGFQCHPEMMKSNIEMMVRHCASDLVAQAYVQSAEQLLGADLRPVNARMCVMLDNFFEIAAA